MRSTRFYFRNDYFFVLKKMAILIAKALHHTSLEQNEHTLRLFQMLIMHHPG